MQAWMCSVSSARLLPVVSSPKTSLRFKLDKTTQTRRLALRYFAVAPPNNVRPVFVYDVLCTLHAQQLARPSTTNGKQNYYSHKHHYQADCSRQGELPREVGLPRGSHLCAAAPRLAVFTSSPRDAELSADLAHRMRRCWRKKLLKQCRWAPAQRSQLASSLI